MAERLRVFAQHGWGFDSRAWQHWLQDFAVRNGYVIEAQCADRGYYQATSPEPKQPLAWRSNWRDSINEKQSLQVVIAHSLGLHLLPENLIAECDLLMVISGFSYFNELDAKRGQKLVSRMLTKLQHDPTSVVRDFLQNCYDPMPPGMVMSTGIGAAVRTGQINVDALQKDLQLLAENVLPLELLASARRVLLLHGTADSIVHYEHSERLHAVLPNSSLVLFADEGHALPFTNPAGCHLSLRQAIFDCTASLPKAVATYSDIERNKESLQTERSSVCALLSTGSALVQTKAIKQFGGALTYEDS